MATNTNGFGSGVDGGLADDIVKQGFLWVKRPPRSYWNRIKAWHKRYFVLRDSVMDNTSILEMHNNQHDIKANCTPLLALELNETVHIGIASESHRFSNVLVLVCNGRAPLLLAADDEMGARSWLLALDLTAQSRNTDTSLMSVMSTSAKYMWNNNSCQNTVCTTHSDRHSHHHTAGHHTHHQNSESDDSTNGSACSCAPAFVRESSGFSDPTHGMSRLSGSSVDRIPDDLLWTTDWHQNSSLEPGLVLERFQVYVLPTDASERACLRGQLQLVIFTRGVGVARIGDYECFLLWPIAFIRQYRHESVKNSKNSNHPVIISQSNNKYDKRQTVVTLEVGRRCLTGEGVFSFRTSSGQEVMRQLKRAITNWAQYKANCRSNSRSVGLNVDGAAAATTQHRSHRYSRSRSSAPCTPNMSVTMLDTMGGGGGGATSAAGLRTTTPSPRKQFKVRRGDTEPPLPVTTAPKLTKDKSRSIGDDVNYVIPIFDDNEDDVVSDHQKSNEGDYINGCYKSMSLTYHMSGNKGRECCRRRQSNDSGHRQRVINNNNNNNSNNCHKSVTSRSNSGNSNTSCVSSLGDESRCGVDSSGGAGSPGVVGAAIEANPYLELIAT